MATEIIVALIAAGGGLLGSLIGIRKNTDMMDYRLQQLEKKVDKHNNLVERTYELEGWTEVYEEKLKVANHRINDLEEKGGK